MLREGTVYELIYTNGVANPTAGIGIEFDRKRSPLEIPAPLARLYQGHAEVLCAAQDGRRLPQDGQEARQPSSSGG